MQRVLSDTEPFRDIGLEVSGLGVATTEADVAQVRTLSRQVVRQAVVTPVEPGTPVLVEVTVTLGPLTATGCQMVAVELEIVPLGTECGRPDTSTSTPPLI